jgi:DNA-binding IclR family transcriptional regulator
MARPRLNGSAYTLKSIDRVATLLNHFSARRPTLDLREASHALDVPRSTAYRLLRSMEASGLLVFDEARGTYRLSMGLARLGQVAVGGIDLQGVCRPYLRRLVEETGESSFLLIVEGGAAVVIDTQESEAPLKLTLPVGMPWPLHAGASNKVLLANLPAEEQAAYLQRPLARVTSRTVTDPKRVLRELARIRRQGYAISTGEMTPGVVGVAVPILSGGRLLGALAVAGPVSRLPSHRLPYIVARLKVAAAGVVSDLGGTATQTKSRRWTA